MDTINFQALAEKSRNQPARAATTPAKPPELPVEVFEQGIRLLQASGLAGVDDETLTVWYAIVRDVPQHIFVEAIPLILSGKLRADEYASSTERSVPALICGYHESRKSEMARATRMAQQQKIREEFETMERVPLEDVKKFCKELRAK